MHVYHTRRAVIRPAHKWIVLFARADWLARWFSQVLFLAFKWRHKNPYSKIARTFKVLSPSSKISLKNKLRCKFSTWHRFPFWKYSSFASLLCVTLIWRPTRPSHALKNNLIAWYYALWMVKVLENVFRGIICSFAVNNWSNLWRYLKPDVRIISGHHICAPRRSTNRVGRNRRPKTKVPKTKTPSKYLIDI